MRTCKAPKCKVKFEPRGANQLVCSAPCATAYHKVLTAKKWRKEKKEIKEKLKTNSDYVKELQKIFNTFIRTRDRDKECISCDTPMKGRKGDASHYWSVGGNPGVRFDEDNCHLACVPCNQHKHGNLLEYGIRLPKRIGTILFNALNVRRTQSNPRSIPELKDLKIYYRDKIKELKD